MVACLCELATCRFFCFTSSLMTNAIRVHVVRRKGLNLYLRYVDPVTGKRCERSSGSVDMKSAYRAVAQ